MSEKIDINLADADTLATISGIGPALAARIIEYRQTVHPFEEVIELTAVPGISEKMVRGFEDLVTVQPAMLEDVVPLQLEEPEDIPLLEAPEPMELLPAPEPEEDVEVIFTPEDEPAMETFEMEEEAEEVTAVPQPEPVAPMNDTVGFTEPVFSERSAAPPARPPVDWEGQARRRGCLNTLLGATFGAILGAVLTLAVLAAINRGSLTYSARDEAIQQQLDAEIQSRSSELNQFSTRVSLAATQEAEANQSLESQFSTANEAINNELDNNEAIISYLATRSWATELRLDEVAGSAETFNDFLDGMRSLLDDLEGGTATPPPLDDTVTPTYTPTPTPFEGTQTPEVEATTAVQPTRTPLPTATPFTFPTNTPAPQP